MKTIFSGRAILATAFLSGFLVFSARPLVADTLLSQFPQQEPQPSQTLSQDPPVGWGILRGEVTELTKEAASPGSPSARYVATAYSLRGRTASGRFTSHGVIAADPRVLPLGSRVRLEAGPWSGEYLVADTGGAIRGRKIDIWTPSTREALRFGRRSVKLTVLSYGSKRFATQRRGKI